MLLYNDYIFTLLSRNSLHPFENEKGLGKELQAVVQSDVG